MKTPTLYTVTPNPALDVSGHVDRLLVNEKNYVHDERRDPGGNGINAARVARRLGARVLALGFLGGDAGEDIRKRLHEEGVPSAFTPIREHTRINVTVTNDADCKQTRLTFHGPQVRASECANLMSQIRKLHAPGILILGGSMPPGLPANFHGALARRGIARGLGVVVDVPAKLMKSVLGLDLLLLKPNEVELAEFAGR
ncbi:MAG: 1-phosphofructokinase family hexose kinase, partial [Bdellovibrionota bacterium]